MSDAFRHGIAPADVDMGVSFHEARLFLDRDAEPQLLYLMSIGDVRAGWPGEERNDHVTLSQSVDEAKGWDALYFAKRIWQVNSKDKQVAAALEPIKRILGSGTTDTPDLLATMPYEELRDFVRLGQLVERGPGETICRYGDPGES